MVDYRQMAADAARRYNIPVDLFLAQINQESRFNPQAVSPVGAIGLGQIMPGTAKELGVDPTDPMQNLEGSARYLSQQYNRFGDWGTALAAYNAGPGAVSKYGGIPPYKETQNYVRTILGNVGRGTEVAADTMAALGKGGGAVTPDQIAQSAQAQSTGMQEEQQPRGLLGNLFGNPDLMANLAIAFNSMRLNPDPNLPQVLSAQMKERRDEKKTEAMKNRTVEALKKMGADPKLIELAQAGFGTDALRAALSGTADKTPAEVRSLQIRAEAAGLVPGTPEYQEFMLYGGGKRDVTPAAFTALDAQARAAGFIPKSEGGDGSYENFMATRGAGLSAEAAASGKARGQSASQLPGAEVSARRALELVDLLRNDPALEAMVGPIQGRLPNISGASQRFQSRLAQLQGTAFLEAYNMLRGGGQITENEGKKAEAAIARLNVAQNEEDFLEALKEFEDAVRTGVAKLQAQASGVSPQPSVVKPPASAGGDNDPLGIRKR